MPMKTILTKELMDKVNSQGIPLTTAQWFTLNNYMAMEKWTLLEILQYIKPEAIYDMIEKMQEELREKRNNV